MHSLRYRITCGSAQVVAITRPVAQAVKAGHYDIELGVTRVAGKDEPTKPLRFRPRRPSSD